LAQPNRVLAAIGRVREVHESGAAVARYQFYQQRTASEVRDNVGNLIAADADQNRLFVGLQFGYPITFDRP